MKKILIFGSYHGNNKGDELIFYSIFNKIRMVYGNKTRISIITKSKEYFHRVYDINVISPYNLINIIGEIKNSDLILVGGGGLFFDYSIFDTLKMIGKSQLLYWIMATQLSSFFKKRVIWYSVGIGPLNTRLSKFLIKWASKSVSEIIVRDSLSKKILQDIGIEKIITESRDVVFGEKFSKIRRNKTLTKNKYILLIPRYWKEKEADIIYLYSQIIKTLLKNKKRVVISETNSLRDSKLSGKIIRQFDKEENLYHSSIKDSDYPEKLVELVMNSEYLISMRMHPIIIASLFNVPSIAIEYKTPKILECMRDIGMENFCFSFPFKKKLETAILNIDKDKIKISRMLKEKLAKIKKLEYENIKKLRLY